MDNDIGPSCKKCSETVPRISVPPIKRIPIHDLEGQFGSVSAWKRRALHGGTSLRSGKKKEHKPKCWVRISSGGGLPCEGVGAKKFGMKTKLFGGTFAGIFWRCPKSLRKKFVFNLLAPMRLTTTF